MDKYLEQLNQFISLVQQIIGNSNKEDNKYQIIKSNVIFIHRIK